MALLRAIALAGLTLSSLVPGAYGRDPFIQHFPRLYEDFMSIFESLGGRRYLEAVQNGEEVNMQQDYTALDNFFGLCLREVISTDLPFLRPDVLNGYDKIEACVNPATQCDGEGEGPIRFTQAVNNAKGTEFRFGFDGPGNLQGTFWIQDQNPPDGVETGAVLMNFAKSLDPTPLSPGAVLQPDPQGVNFKIRVAGDRTFAFATDGGDADSAYDQAIRQDLIYDYQLTSGNNPFNPAGSIATPQQFDVFPTFKVPGMPCIRIKFRPCLFFIYQLDLLIQPRAAEADPRVWTLAVKQFGSNIATYNYNQIIDGNGDKTSLYNGFVGAQEDNDKPGVVIFRGLRDNTPLVPCGIVI